MTHFNESKLSRIIARRIIAPEDRSQMLPFCTPIYCPNYKGVRASRVTVINPNTNSFNVNTKGDITSIGVTQSEVDENPNINTNTFDIDMTIPVSHTYFLPHEVDLETDINMQEMIKSDFAVRFKKEVSAEILRQIIASKASIPTITKGANIATTIGTAIADNILNGTGQRYSIYKYDNGAPVSTLISSNQPNIDDLALGTEKPDGLLSEVPQSAYKREYALKDDVDVPAMFFIEQPTLLLNPTDFTSYQVGLCNGDVKDYARKTLSIDTTKVDFSAAGTAIFGTNDTFAVAFTEAMTKVQPDKKFYANNITITVYFGVKLVHTNNLRLLD